MEATTAKGICIAILLVITLLFGFLPYALLANGNSASQRAARIRQTLVAYLSCFAGGVFLSVCLLHLLPEGIEDMDEYFVEIDKDIDFPVYEAITGAGFFIIAAVEQLAHKLLHNHHRQEQHHHHHHNQLHHPDSSDNNCNASITVKDGVQAESQQAESDHKDNEEGVFQLVQASPTKSFLLLTALSFHTVFDGLAVGLQTSTQSLWQTFIAVVVHKCLVSFCLGLQLFTVYKTKPRNAFMWMCFFSIVTPIGIGIGMFVTSGAVDELAKTLVAIVLKGVATGAFIFVTFFEILREELVEKPGLLRLLAVIIGFAAMAIPKFLDVSKSDDEKHLDIVPQ